MATDPTPAADVPDDVDAAVASLYRGPLDEFIAARDELARSLRAAGRREDATMVKALRKPKRIAWALDVGAGDDPAAVEGLAEAVEAVTRAQDGDGDLREALKALPAAQRELADAAARASAAAGSAVDPAELGPAVLAIVADPEALEALRTGRLVDIPPAGGFGLDAVTGAAPARPAAPAGAPRGRRAKSARTTKAVISTRAEAPVAPAPPPDRRALAAAQRALDRAEAAAGRARDRAEAAERAVRDAAAAVEAAEERRRTAEREARHAQRRLDAARRNATPAADDLGAAEEAVADARSVLDGLGG